MGEQDIFERISSRYFELTASERRADLVLQCGSREGPPPGRVGGGPHRPAVCDGPPLYRDLLPGPGGDGSPAGAGGRGPGPEAPVTGGWRGLSLLIKRI